ncbi:MAG TPA: hypothetical protein VFY06_08470, partial [Verrucomicrobiae bacterium]|nr:hypothetical protein [Verrucomicrobiae bacterium]
MRQLSGHINNASRKASEMTDCITFYFWLDLFSEEINVVSISELKPMKDSYIVSLGFLPAFALVISLNSGHAQATADWNKASDTQVLLQAVEMLPTSPAASAPKVGTFYSAQHAPGTRQAWPPLPANTWQLPVWNLGDGTYLLDDLRWNYSAPLLSSGLMTPNASPGGITNVSSPALIPRPVYTTNDLWLEITGKTNETDFLTVHPQWNATNEVYDLYYTTNLSAPENWSWVMRSQAGQTNLNVDNATDEQGFYRLGPLNDPIGNDSLGTNFWLAFMAVEPSGVTTLSLFVSSPVGAIGTVTIPGLGLTNSFSVAARAGTNISVSIDALMGYYNDTIANFGVHVTASQPLSVYGLNYDATLSAAFAGCPTSLLGTNYCLLSKPDLSEFAIVATEDNTTVNIVPSPTANLDGSRGTAPYTLTNLQAGQTYQNMTRYDLGDPSAFDVTGTWIKSDKPIAVIAGNYATYIPDIN